MTVFRCLALDYASNFLFQALGVGAVCGIVLGLGFLSCAVLLSIGGPVLAEFWWWRSSGGVPLCSCLLLVVECCNVWWRCGAAVSLWGGAVLVALW
jgi:hypothetical protein